VSVSPSGTPSVSPSASPSPPVSSSSAIVGQIFKNPQNNINSVAFTAKSGQPETELDNLETGDYANDAALQAVWIKAGTDEAVRDLTVKPAGSNMSMKLDSSNDDGEWAADIDNMPNGDTTINFANGIISFKWYQTHVFADLQANIFIKDTTPNKSVVPLVIADADVGTWVTFNIPISEFTSGTPADITDIENIGFEVEKKKVPSSFFYVDSLTYIISAGTIKMKLWEFGTTAPVSGVAKLSDANQYETLGDLSIDGQVVSEIDVPLLPGQRLYHVHGFSAGPAFEKSANNPLIVDTYYAITFHFVDEITKFYGNNDGKLADSEGYSFTTPDENTAIEATGAGENLQFYLFCVKPVYVVGYHLHMLDVDGVETLTGLNSEWTTIIEDADDVPVIIDEHHHHAVSDYRYNSMAELMGTGGKFETKYVPGTDDVVSIVQEMIYLYQKIPVLS
jgi:hypothetical protein